MSAPTEQRAPGGRPSKLTPERAEAILTSIEQGSYLKVAALAAGVGEATLHRWLANGAAAQSRADAHDPDRRYCPSCDLDRTDDARSVDDANAREEERNRLTGNTSVQYTVLAPCPACGSTDNPGPFALPPEQEAYREFRESVTRAEAKAEALLVGAWQAAAFGPDGDWRAARDMLARRAPERWAGVTRIQMTNEETERRLDDAVTEALLLLGLGHSGTDDDLPRETDEEPPR